MNVVSLFECQQATIAAVDAFYELKRFAYLNVQVVELHVKLGA